MQMEMQTRRRSDIVEKEVLLLTYYLGRAEASQASVAFLLTHPPSRLPRSESIRN